MISGNMKVSDFDYELPTELIAYYPESKRDQSRLMVLNRNDYSLRHTRFCKITEFLKPGDLLVLNNTKVIPARLYCRTDDDTEKDILLEERIDQFRWKFLMKKPKEGMVLHFDQGIKAQVLKNESGDWIIEFECEADGLIENFGFMPLPPYIERMPDEKDRESYQTVYAERSGAIAAPTAGLHFTDELMEEISGMGISFTDITLHVGIGTFRPVKNESLEDHKMHMEYMEIPQQTVEKIRSTKEEGGRIVAVGTTVVRALESAVNKKGELVAGSFDTDLFIYPPYDFRLVDAMITNFHMPRSTLLMLVAAFAGREFILKAYNEAVKQRYRLLSYGDSMLIV